MRIYFCLDKRFNFGAIYFSMDDKAAYVINSDGSVLKSSLFSAKCLKDKKKWELIGTVKG